MPVARQRVTIDGKVEAEGLLPKEKIERPAKQNNDGPETVGIGFHR